MHFEAMGSLTGEAVFSEGGGQRVKNTENLCLRSRWTRTSLERKEKGRKAKCWEITEAEGSNEPRERIKFEVLLIRGSRKW